MTGVQGGCSFLLLVILLGSVSPVVSEEPTIRLRGRKENIVTRSVITVGDIVDVTSSSYRDDDAVIGLKKIRIVSSPNPGEEVTISADRILGRLRDEGVDLKAIGYTLPRVTVVTRASHAISYDEIRAAIEEYLHQSESDVILKAIDYNEPVLVTPGTLSLEVQPYTLRDTNRMGFWITAKGKDDEKKRFPIRATVEEWRQVPVASRPIREGSIIGLNDFHMARMNLKEVPRDTTFSKEQIIGLEASQSIGFGEVFRKTKLNIPPVVASGSTVTIRYRKGAITATASGVALEDGVLNQEIRIRNSASKKVVQGRVIEPGLVGVE